MNCKKCGSIIDKDANFCPYCGELVLVEENKREYDDPFKNLRIDTSHNSQYEYQEDYSNVNKVKYPNEYEVNKYNRSNKSLFGLILGIISIFLCFISHAAISGIVTAIIAFVLALVGKKETSKGFGIASLIITIFTFVITLILNILLFIGSIELELPNGYTTTIKDYLTDAFFCGFYEHKLEGYWLDNANELFYLDDEGNYYIYLDSNELTDNYYYGTYKIEDGLDLNRNETLFADEDYYYYQVTTMFNKTKMEGKVYSETIDLLKHGFTLKLNKEDKNKLIFTSGDTEIEFEKR